MSAALTAVIPIRHQSNSSDWARLKRDLTETVRSIASQDSSDWKAVIVANYGADLPGLPANFDVKWVDFPPNELHERGTSDKETFYEAVRLDKERRVLAGMHHAGNMNYVMVVDDHDLVSSKLTSFAAAMVQVLFLWPVTLWMVSRLIALSVLIYLCQFLRPALATLG